MRRLPERFLLDRRSWMLTAAGAGLSFLVPPLSARAAERRGPERAKSLLTVWLAGGPSQLETWDPHPGGANGGPTKAISTNIAGLQIADAFPQTAEVIGALSVIRSLVSKEGDHERGTYHLRTGYRPDPSVRHPSLGSILVHEQPPKGLALPPHVAIDGGPWPPRGGFLGDEYDAFRIGNPGGPIANATPRVADDRQHRRMNGLAVLERSFTVGRPTAERRTLHQQTTQDALALMSSEQLKAFEIGSEPAEVRAAYGDDRFGKSCLVARRLIETGVRSVEVTLDGFDSHTNNFDVHREKAANPRSGTGDADQGFDNARSLVIDGRARVGRIRTHPEDQPIRRSRSLAERLLVPARRGRPRFRSRRRSDRSRRAQGPRTADRRR